MVTAPPQTTIVSCLIFYRCLLTVLLNSMTAAPSRVFHTAVRTILLKKKKKKAHQPCHRRPLIHARCPCEGLPGPTPFIQVPLDALPPASSLLTPLPVACLVPGFLNTSVKHLPQLADFLYPSPGIVFPDMCTQFTPSIILFIYVSPLLQRLFGNLFKFNLPVPSA